MPIITETYTEQQQVEPSNGDWIPRTVNIPKLLILEQITEWQCCFPFILVENGGSRTSKPPKKNRDNFVTPLRQESEYLLSYLISTIHVLYSFQAREVGLGP